MLQQRTLKPLTRAVGVGLHSGQRVELQKAPKKFLPVKKPVEVREGEGLSLKWALLGG